ncbi:hypothetical protein [Geoalkalibacter halelectricus]|uniref:Uncharacterized protein n=1 Tax=Geoalkalibacter halelectricus TaxID=2847045 RepID=A0ABY5ZKJ7_9BACT|nr:hypothetical protein [Geoalkalibacter halelectricus]MDO3377857.1 hypothetical protein [Geoalkalibacter halelectricus]UWZ79697.1 hypothetical protein L9S41_18745 [Geoalkalibacter halelectricus]
MKDLKANPALVVKTKKLALPLALPDFIRFYPLLSVFFGGGQIFIVDKPLIQPCPHSVHASLCALAALRETELRKTCPHAHSLLLSQTAKTQKTVFLNNNGGPKDGGSSRISYLSLSLTVSKTQLAYS